MRILIVAVGRMKAGPERELIARYLDRATQTGKALGLGPVEVVELAESRASATATRKAEEARAIHAAVPEGAMLIALDEHGKALGSDPFAQKLAALRDGGQRCVCLLIGGADGLDPDLIARADLVLALSPMTWPHQIVRILIAEQVYRATTILSGHPYHRA